MAMIRPGGFPIHQPPLKHVTSHNSDRTLPALLAMKLTSDASPQCGGHHLELNGRNFPTVAFPPKGGYHLGSGKRRFTDIGFAFQHPLSCHPVDHDIQQLGWEAEETLRHVANYTRRFRSDGIWNIGT